MSTEVKVPDLPESVADATLVDWHFKVGDYVNEGEPAEPEPHAGVEA